MTTFADVDPNAPWIPENARPFLVGDRVRVRLSPECRGMTVVETRSSRAFSGVYCHAQDTDGKVGIVNRILPERSPHEHEVVIDGGFHYLDLHFQADDFAASELEHLDEVTL
jgi:hypothetical protein